MKRQLEFTLAHWQALERQLVRPSDARELHTLAMPASIIGRLSNGGYGDIRGNLYTMTYDWTEAERLKKNPHHHVLLGSRGYSKITDHSMGMGVLKADPSFNAHQVVWELEWTHDKIVEGGLIYVCVTPAMAQDAEFLHGLTARGRRVAFIASRAEGYMEGVCFLVQLTGRVYRRAVKDLNLLTATVAAVINSRGNTVLVPSALVIPESPGPKVFQSTYVDPERALEIEKSSSVWNAFETSMRGRRDAAHETPPLPLRQGHVALQLATGRLDGVIGTGPLRHVVKGRVIRRLGDPEEVLLDDGRKEITRLETLGIEIAALTPEGGVYTFASVDEAEKED